jgi:hypothetical protein
MPFRSAPRVRFDSLDRVPKLPGLYELSLRSGRLLKVGIASNLRRRLRSHAASRQGSLCLKPGGHRRNPNDVSSKSSILAKHLYYDATLTHAYDLTTENGRQQFLHHRCLVRYVVTATRDVAKVRERELERSGKYRYVGRVVVRAR